MSSSSEKSGFSHTCSLLRQYLMEKKGSIGELSLGMSKGVSYEMSRPVATTMNLFPILEKPAAADGLSGNDSKMNMELFPQSSQNKMEAKDTEGAQMTIFYDGRVFVIDDISADKAKEIMFFASQQNQGAFSASNPSKEQSLLSANAVINATTGPGNRICPTGDSIAAPKFGNTLMPEHVQRRTAQPITCDLPIQRKASLHRFLEKRKDRINRSTPYQTSSTSAVSSKPAAADQPAKTPQSTSQVAVERDLLSNLSS